MVLSEEEFAVQTWGEVELGDKRLTARAVYIGARMAAHPEASLATQMQDPGGLEGAYRMMNHEGVTLRGLLAPTYERTRQLASEKGKVVLWVNDQTELDYTFQRAKGGMGPIGDGKGRGLLMHSTLAIRPEMREVVGLGNVQVYLRVETPKPEPKSTRTMEGRVWEVAADEIGAAPEGVIWVEVSDRGSDSFLYMAKCVELHKEFLIRIAHNRRLVQEAEGEADKIMDYARSLLPQGGTQREVAVPSSPQQAARSAQVVMAWAPVVLPPSSQAPKEERKHAPLRVWVLRVWEPHPPEAVEGLEWILLSSLPVTTPAEADERVDWYTCRWFCEDFHQCLKTGCQIEHSQLSDREDTEALLGFVAPIAVRLLQLRQTARQPSEHLAVDEVDPLMVEVVAAKTKQDNFQTMPLLTFWLLVARLGGFQGRKRDGNPGWRTLWWGWRYASDLTNGARIILDRRTKL